MRQTTPQPAGPNAPPRALTVTHALLGRWHAGKTSLLRLTHRRALPRKLPSGLSFDMDDPRRTIGVLKEYSSTRELLKRRGLPATQQAVESMIELYAAERKLAVVRSRDAVGQVYAHTTLTSPADQQERYQRHLDHLARCNVLWVVLSVPAEGSTSEAISRYEDDLAIMGAYLRESLRLRRPDQACAVALVITKLDTLFDTEDAARRRWTDDELAKVVGPLASLLEDSDKVEQAIINPVSAFGFGNAELLELPDAESRAESDDREPEWVLRRDATVQPYNVMPLLAWTFLAGMLAQDGWQIPIKGGG